MNATTRKIIYAIITIHILCASSQAQNIHAGLRTGAFIAFPGSTTPILGIQLELRALIGDEFGLRFDLGFNSGIGLLAVTRPIPEAFGPLYLGLGIGHAFNPNQATLDTRALIGYEWVLTPELRVLIEACARWPWTGINPALEINAGLNWQLSGITQPSTSTPLPENQESK